ncbi:MAG: LytTR family DNA-binding domain-containing protein [Clostridiales bacterium]
MNIAIVDDSNSDCFQLINFLTKYSNENALLLTINSFENGEKFLNSGNLSKIDAIFLDIYMDKVNGMEVAQEIRKQGLSCNIIFTTTSESFAVQSYEVRAFDYLVKPITYEKIDKVMSLLDKSTNASSHFIIVKEGRELRRILVSDIIYADYHNHYVQIHTDKYIISTYKKFGDFEEELLNYKSFITCYRCILVNMNKIEKVEEGFFLMKNGEYVPINRNRAREIKNRYIDYIFGEMEIDANV